MRRSGTTPGISKSRAVSTAGVVLVSVLGPSLTMLTSCGDSPGAPEETTPPAEAPSGASDRALPEGTYDVALVACETCSAGSVPDYLAAFSEGVDGTIAVSAATESTASLLLLEMRSRGTKENLLGLFGASVVPLAWDGPASEFSGFVEYGTAALFIAELRRSDGEIRCDFDLFHLKHDVGPTSCVVLD